MTVIEKTQAAHLQLLKVREVATLLDISPYTLYAWLDQGKGPRCLRIGTQTIRFRISDVEAWLASQNEEV